MGNYKVHYSDGGGRGYGLSNLVGDVVLFGATGGLWIIWVIIRELRR